MQLHVYIEFYKALTENKLTSIRLLKKKLFQVVLKTFYL